MEEKYEVFRKKTLKLVAEKLAKIEKSKGINIDVKKSTDAVVQFFKREKREITIPDWDKIKVIKNVD